MGVSAGASALITGANKGIGFEIARQLGQAGLQIIIGARNPERGAEAAHKLAAEGIAARYLHIDLTDPASADQAAADIRSREGALKILVNNAGISDPQDGSPEHAELGAVRRVVETNFLGDSVRHPSHAATLEERASGTDHQSLQWPWVHDAQ